MSALTCVLLAGGKGTRLQEITHGSIPKPMVPLCGIPIICRQVEMLAAQGVTHFIMTVGYLKEQIKNYFGHGEKWGVTITYIEEETPLGSGGALWYLKGKMTDDFFIVNADLVLDMDIGRMLEFHKAHSAVLTLLAHPNSHPYDSDLVLTGDNDRVSRFLKKNEPRTGYERNLVNAGVFVASPESLDVLGNAPASIGLEHGFVQALLDNGSMVCAYRTSEYIRDAGTPERMAQAEKDLQSGAIAARNLQKPQKAIFLDRDGTMNECAGFICRPEQLSLLPGAADAVKKINQSGYLAIVVTNQPVVARGECTLDTLNDINGKLEEQLGKEGAYLDDLFYCPHHPDRGFAGEVPALKIKCTCRKPNIGMIEAAVKKYNIDVSASWIIGDTNRDMQTGFNAGLRTARVQSPEGETEEKLPSTLDCSTLADAVKQVLEG